MEGDRAFSETSIVDTDMPASVFILGREPHLSVAEIAAVVGDGADWTKAELSAEALIVESGICPPKADPTWAENLESGISARSLMNRLGGTIKIGEAWRRISHDEFLISHDEAIGTFILSACGGSAVGGEHSTRKVHFGFSVYNLGGGQKRVEEVRRALTRGAAKQKTALKEHGRTARWVTSRESTLSSVIVQKEKLLPEQNGIEVLVLVGPNHITLARTLTVQPFEDWGRRDYGKPARNMTRGMLPPKLARAMVNMAGVKSSKLKAQSSNQIQKSKGKNSVFGIRYSEFTLLDPFCGTGTVLLEALALGCRVIGSDNDAAAIAESRANIQWALGADAEQHDRVQLCVADVRELRSCVPAASVDAVVTEPSLGPVRWSGVRGQVSGVVHELHALYVAAFREFAKVLKSGGRAVFVVPVFRSGATEHAVDIIRDVERLGFRRVNPFPSALRAHAALHGREDLPYARQDQRVGRQILLFERT